MICTFWEDVLWDYLFDNPSMMLPLLHSKLKPGFASTNDSIIRIVAVTTMIMIFIYLDSPPIISHSSFPSTMAKRLPLPH